MLIWKVNPQNLPCRGAWGRQLCHRGGWRTSRQTHPVQFKQLVDGRSTWNTLVLLSSKIIWDTLVSISRYLTRYLCGWSLCHWLCPVAHLKLESYFSFQSKMRWSSTLCRIIIPLYDLACQYCTLSSEPLYIANTFSFHSGFQGFDAGS